MSPRRHRPLLRRRDPGKARSSTQAVVLVVIVLRFVGLGTLQRRRVCIRSVNCDGGKRLLVKACHFDLKQRAAFGADEFP